MRVLTLARGMVCLLASRLYIAPALIFLSLYFTITATALAQISVNNVIVHMPYGKRPIQNVIVGNSSKNPVYVVSSVEWITEPTSKQSPAQPSTDILVSPRAFSVEPQGQRTVRLLVKEPPGEKERVYRVSFVPEGRSGGEEKSLEVGGRRAAIQVMTGMGLLVFLDPMNPKGELSWTRYHDKLVFSNTGNQHVQIVDGKSCSSEKQNCTALPAKRVYGGDRFEVPVAGDRLVTYMKRIGPSGSFQALEIGPLDKAGVVQKSAADQSETMPATD